VAESASIYTLTFLYLEILENGRASVAIYRGSGVCLLAHMGCVCAHM
jgi:hypothetical protein